QHGVATVREPGAVLAPPARAIWWQCVRSREPVVARLRLTRGERMGLVANGVDVVEPVHETARIAARWRRALAAQSVILVVPRAPETGEPAYPHPIVDELASAPILDALDAPPTRVVLRPPPEPVIAVDLAEPVAPLALESASSIERLLGCSLAYVLRYR